MASICEQVEQGKTSWPELVGETGECAATTIKNENPLVNTRIILEGTVIPLISAIGFLYGSMIRELPYKPLRLGNILQIIEVCMFIMFVN
ncbi:putative proteinase inhibitor I13, potato inhibitor I [Helianthus annuus]|nr:putative proteinase inhibitor I13, potato inhibitor I [Helianthus annuus]